MIRRQCVLAWAAALLAATPGARAQQGAGDDREKDHRYVLIERDTAIDSSGRRTIRSRVIVEVLKPSAIEQVGNVMVGYNAYYQRVRLLRAETRTADGRTVAVAKSAVLDVVAKDAGDCTLYSDARTLSFPMPQVEVGARLDYEIEIADRRPVIAGHAWDSVYIDTTVPVERFRYRLEVPSRAAYTILTPHLPDGPEVEQRRRTIVRTWTLENVPAMRIEWRMPDPRTLARAIHVTSVPSWDVVRGWYAPLLAGKDRLTDEMKEKARALTREAATDGEKVAALCTFVQNEIRYVGLELGRSAYEPHPAAECYAMRYGDCKDKSVLLCALLRECGIAASLALVQPYSYECLLAETPHPGQFNHAIVVCTADGRRWWLDPTARHLTPGAIPPALQNMDALVIDEPGNGLVRIPADDPDAHLFRTVIDVRMDAFGRCRVRDTDYFAGVLGIGQRHNAEGEDPGDARKRMEQYVEERSPTGRLIDHGHSDPADMRRPFERWVEYEADDALVRTDDGFGLPVAIEEIGVAAPILLWMNQGPDHPQEPRRQDWVSGFARATEWVCRIHLPPGFRLAEPIHERRFELPHGALSVRGRQADGVVEAVVRAELKPARIPAASWAAAEAATRRAIAGASLAIVVQDDLRALLQRKQPAAALAAARAATLAAPADPAAWRREGRVLWSCGQPAAARRAFAEAIRLDPAHLPSYVDLAVTWGARDDARPEPPVFFDRAAAANVLAEAVEKTGDRPAARLALARLYECNDQGAHFGTKAPLDRAIEIYHETLRRTPDDRETLLRLGECCLRAGRFEDAETAYRTLHEKRPTDFAARSGLWICAAFRGRTEESLSAILGALGSEHAAGEIARLGATLLGRRRYAEAADFLDRRGAVGTAGRDARKMTESLRRLGAQPAQAPEDFFDLSTPGGAALTLMAAICTQDPAKAAKVVSRRMEATDDDIRGGILEWRPAAERRDEDLGMLWDFFRGLFTCSERQRGPDDAVVTFTPAEEIALMPKMTFYAVREDGGWRITGSRESAFGVEALARVAASFFDEGDIDRARAHVDQMLAVAREARGPDSGSDGGDSPLLGPLLDLPYPDGATRLNALLAAGILGMDTAPRALRYARRALETMPEQLPIAKVAAMAHLLMGNDAAAVGTLEPFAARRALDRVSRMLYASALARAGRPDDALAEYRAMEEIYSADAGLIESRIEALLVNGRYDEGLRQLLAHATRLDPVDALRLEASFRGRLGQRAELGGIRDKLTRIPDLDAGSFVFLWEAFQGAGDRDGAVEQLQCALLADPRSRLAALFLASEWLADGPADEARMLADGIAREGDLWRLDRQEKVLLAQLMASMGRFDEALGIWDEPGLPRHGRNGIYRALHRALGLESLGRPDEARTALREAVADWGPDLWPGPLLRCLADGGAVDELVALAESVESRPMKDDRLCEVYFYNGAWALAHGRNAEAAALLRKAVDTRSVASLEWRMAGAFLRRMDSAGPGAGPAP